MSNETKNSKVRITAHATTRVEKYFLGLGNGGKNIVSGWCLVVSV